MQRTFLKPFSPYFLIREEEREIEREKSLKEFATLLG